MKKIWIITLNRNRNITINRKKNGNRGGTGTEKKQGMEQKYE